MPAVNDTYSVLAGGALTVGLTTSDQMVVSLVASRTSGPAPLAVHFDATGTTHVTDDSFREVGYYFDYDDSGSGTWTHSGESKNIDKGAPLGAHVFETPGTYDVRVRARDAAGEVEDAQVTITVTDPDVVYAGTDTVCISTTSDTTGAPVGASLLTNQTSWPTFESNKRYLFRAGQNFTSFGTLDVEQIQDSQFGSFGTGAKPIISALNIEVGNPASSGVNWADRVSISDLDTGGFENGNTCRHILLLRVDSVGCMDWGSDVSFYAGWSGLTQAQRDAMERPSYITVVEPTITSHSDSNPNSFTAFGRVALMGAELANCPQHVVRIWTGYKAVIRHNRLYGGGGSQADIKFNALGVNEGAYTDNWNALPDPMSRYGVIGNNSIGDSGDTNTWSVIVQPQSDNWNEGVADVIVEDNTWQVNKQTEVVFGGRRLVARGNSSPNMDYIVSRFLGSTDGSWDGPYYTGGSSITTESPR